MARFIDRVTVEVQAGDGGHGCVSVHREKFKPLGGPDGGNGGRGGDIVLEVDPGVHTLLDFHYRPHAHAASGRPGMGGHRSGAAGDDLLLAVPDGTVIVDADGEVVADLIGVGTRLVIARGGRGGLGNASLASKARRAPGFALLGEPGDAAELTLEVKSVADVGLIGFPSSGKSSLVSVLSAARPKIAEYPFTTLQPNLGVVTAGAQTITVADVPGLIPGASSGRGLGLEFLRHIERCAVLVHVVDCATIEPGRDPASDIVAVETELAQYTPSLDTDLSAKPRLVALNKVDVPQASELADFVTDDLQARGYRVFPISTATHQGLRELTYAMAEVVAVDRASRPANAVPRTVIRPAGVDASQFDVEPDPANPGGFLVSGSRPVRWVRQTDFTNDEAVGYLADRLAKLGVEDRLAQLGAAPGAAVTIGGVTFDFEPAGPSHEPEPVGRRGTDPRLETTERISAPERKALHRSRRGLPVEVHGPDGAPSGRKGRR